MSHSVALGASWSVWRWTCLRATGFPARLVLELADGELAAAADRLLDQEAEVARRRDAAIAACKAAGERVAIEDRRSVQRALKRLLQHRVPEPLADEAAEAVRRQLADAAARLPPLEGELTACHARAQRAASEALRRRCGDDRFRQALLWQNRRAVHGGIESLLRRPASAMNWKIRRHEQLVASYLQRYCVKNDTIGFFGPVGWARFVDGPVLAQRPGPALVASRTIYYEHWAIHALAGKLAEDPALRPFLAPRRLPQYRVEGTTLHYPIERRAELSAELAAVAARCDGERTARQLARELAGDPALALGDEAAVLEALDELAAARVVTWTLEIPTASVHPEQHLAALLARIEDGELRRRAEAVLEELERRRAAIAASANANAAQLDAALQAFEASFTRATGADSRRAHGQTYAGRTPLYEDCRRDLDVELGRPFLDRLAPPLELLLHSARWFTYEIAARYRRALEAIYRRLRDERGEPVVDFARFWNAIPALFPGGGAPGSIVGAVRAELHRRWATALAIAPAERTVHRRAAALADDVRRAFAAPGPGWPAARHHAPDIMIAAGPEAIARGEYQIILGELHAGFNTMAAPLFVKEHPRPDELVAARDADLGRACIAPVWSTAVTRGDYYSLSPRDLDLESGEARSARPRAQVVATGELVIEASGDRLEVWTRDRARRFDVIAFLEHHLIAESYAAFSPIAPAPWTPRVVVDDVVIARATWRVAPAELAWPALEESAGRFAAARRWARSLGMPRWMFVKTAEEVKPVYVDLDSAVYVDLLAKQLRGASAATLSEMLPAVEDAWVVDGAGERYTAELRIAAVDPEPWRAP
jgi:Lantibiotic dehydratase, N terminus